MAHLHVDHDYAILGDQGRTSVEVREVNSSKAIANIVMARSIDMKGRWEPWNQGPDRLAYCDHGKYLVASAGLGVVYVLETQTYHPHVVIDLTESSDSPVPNIGGAASNLGADSLQTACAAYGNIAIFHMTGGRFGLGFTKVFDLDTGKELPGTGAISAEPTIANIAISPSGARMAMVQSVNDAHPGMNFVVVLFDLRTRGRLPNIPFTYKDLLTDDHRVWFIGESIVVMKGIGHAKGDNSSFHCWNVGTGSEVKAIGFPDADDTGFVGTSADGRVVLSDIGKSHWCATCNRGDGKNEIEYSQIALWDRLTGSMIAQSQRLKVIHHKCPRFYIGAFCDTSDENPRMSISQEGNAVAAFWSSGEEPVLAYTFGNPDAGH